MKGHARHGDRLTRRGAARGEGDVEQARRPLRVVVEELVEVAHAVEQQHVGMLRLQAQVLLHHGRVTGDANGLRCRGAIGRGETRAGHGSEPVAGGWSHRSGSVHGTAGRGGARAQRGREVRCEGLHQLCEDLRVAREHVPGFQVAVLAFEVPDQPPRLGDQQGAGRDVPSLEAELEETVVATGRDVGQVERGGARTAQPRRDG